MVKRGGLHRCDRPSNLSPPPERRTFGRHATRKRIVDAYSNGKIRQTRRTGGSGSVSCIGFGIVYDWTDFCGRRRIFGKRRKSITITAILYDLPVTLVQGRTLNRIPGSLLFGYDFNGAYRWIVHSWSEVDFDFTLRRGFNMLEGFDQWLGTGFPED